MNKNFCKLWGQIITLLQILLKSSKLIKIELEKFLKHSEPRFLHGKSTCMWGSHFSVSTSLFISSCPHSYQLTPFWYNSSDYTVKNAQESRSNNTDTENRSSRFQIQPPWTLVVWHWASLQLFFGPQFPHCKIRFFPVLSGGLQFWISLRL